MNEANDAICKGPPQIYRGVIDVVEEVLTVIIYYIRNSTNCPAKS